ncbi:MAG: DUF4249 domain-containing protein [Bacteroidota bacterium]
MKNIRYIIFIISVVVTYSCETIVNVDLPEHDPLIVVNSIGNPSNDWEMDVSLSKGLLEETEIQTVENAIIEITEDGIIMPEFIFKNNKYTAPNFKPKPNALYELQVDVDGYETVTSNCIIVEPVIIENVTTEEKQGEYEKILDITITFTDHPNQENYYSISMIDSKGNYPVWFSSNDILLGRKKGLMEDDNTFEGDLALFDDLILDGKSYSLKISVDYYDPSTSFIVVLSTLNKDYYKYLQTSKAQFEDKDNPFAEAVIIHNNIKKGLGIFAGYSSSKYEIK